MIVTKAHAMQVQERRYKAEKCGIAKAVRRYMKRANDAGLKVVLMVKLPGDGDIAIQGEQAAA